mmetsp:Transcript_27208/g.47192  ORF Transcript_27208/g.47192 Transcript_27208/m.47192 type:complete len:275 (+) Transcript_27208:1350-2174(+)
MEDQKRSPMATHFTSTASPQPRPSTRVGCAMLNWSRLRSTPRGAALTTAATCLGGGSVTRTALSASSRCSGAFNAAKGSNTRVSTGLTPGRGTVTGLVNVGGLIIVGTAARGAIITALSPALAFVGTVGIVTIAAGAPGADGAASSSRAAGTPGLAKVLGAKRAILPGSPREMPSMTAAMPALGFEGFSTAPGARAVRELFVTATAGGGGAAAPMTGRPTALTAGAAATAIAERVTSGASAAREAMRALEVVMAESPADGPAAALARLMAETRP